jgi:hypothetical protein
MVDISALAPASPDSSTTSSHRHENSGALNKIWVGESLR